MNIDKAAFLIKKAALEFEKISNPFFAQHDLSAAQFKVLQLIYTRESRTARVVDLEREFSMTHPTALGLVEQLEKKGFTTRIPNPEDGRGKLIALTEKADAAQAELEALGNAVEEKLTERLSGDEKGALKLLLRKLLNLPDTPCGTDGRRRQRMRGETEELTVSETEHLGRQHGVGARPIRLAQDYVRKHYGDPLTMKKVSEAVGFSASYFSFLFKKETGENFLHYLTRVRMDRARELLSQTDLSVSQISEQVGYHDANYFTKMFRKENRLSPGQYRRMYG